MLQVYFVSILINLLVQLSCIEAAGDSAGMKYSAGMRKAEGWQIYLVYKDERSPPADTE